MRCDRGPDPRRQDDDLVAGPDRSGGDLTGVPAVVRELRGTGPDHVLDREAQTDLVPSVHVGIDRHRLEVLDQRRAVVVRRVLAPDRDVVAVQRRDRNLLHVIGRPAQRTCQFVELRTDPAEDFGGVVDEVDLVDREYELRHTEQREHRGVLTGLRDDPLARIDEQHHELGGRGAGDGVAGVLDVTRGVGEDEAALRGREVPVGDVDGDALFAFGAQTVDEQREVRGVEAFVDRSSCHSVDLIGEHRLGVVQEPADEGGLAVVDAARGGEAQQLRLTLQAALVEVAHDQK